MSCEFNSKSNYFEKPEALTRLRPQKPAYFQKRQNEQNKKNPVISSYFNYQQNFLQNQIQNQIFSWVWTDSQKRDIRMLNNNFLILGLLYVKMTARKF